METMMNIAGSTLRNAVKAVKEAPKDVAEMKDKLDEIQVMIYDADKMEENHGMKAKVVQGCFRMEDIIDEYTINEGRHLVDDLGTGCVAFTCKTVDLVKAMTYRLQFAYVNEDVKSKFGGISSQTQSSGVNPQRAPPVCIKEAEVVGFDRHIETLKKWSMEGRKELSVICVVGMGGMGKTTLVKKVFDEVCQHFDFHLWIRVSRSYTLEGLLRTMLLKLMENPSAIYALDRVSLITKVREHLGTKRYVVVFDDVWTCRFWVEMKVALIDNKHGSMIFITTRDSEIARLTFVYRRSAFVRQYQLSALSFEESLELFYKKAFGSDLDGHCPSNLRDISAEIVRKCDGLPLVIVVIGGLLSCKGRDACEWHIFNQNLSLELYKNFHLDSLVKILALGYHDLPYNLKRCFLYFGVYPEEYEVEYVRLIRQWVAEGFVKCENMENLEEVAEQYLTELIHRNLVQVSSITNVDKPKSCCVHDLLREMILHESTDLTFCHFAGKYTIWPESTMIRRLTITSSSYKWMTNVKSSSIQSLRVFSDEELSGSFVRSIPMKYKLLKVLDFEGAPLYNYVPEDLGGLFLLRYLSFRNSQVTNLPRSIGMLQNLETLDLRGTFVRKMPREINKLKKLRHLLAYDRFKRIGYGLQMEDGIGDLTSLQTLREVETNHHGLQLVNELGRLTQLRALGLTNVQQEYASVLGTSIYKMQHLEKLRVAAIHENEVIDLHFNESAPVLRKLHLVGKFTFSNWVTRLQNLVKLSLSHSKLTHDPLALLKDLPNLLCLAILCRAYEGKLLQFSNGGFQNLKQLFLIRLYNLNSILIENGALPSLRKFTLVIIPQLTEVPFGVYNLPKLEVVHIVNMPNEFEQSIDHSKGQHRWIKEKVPFLSTEDQSWQD